MPFLDQRGRRGVPEDVLTAVRDALNAVLDPKWDRQKSVACRKLVAAVVNGLRRAAELKAVLQVVRHVLQLLFVLLGQDNGLEK